MPSSISLRVANKPLEVRAAFAKIRVGAFQPGSEKVPVGLAVDAKIEGFNDKNEKQVIAIKGGGELDVMVCNDDDKLKEAFAAPKVPAAGTGPVAGKLSSGPFTMKKVFAYLVHDDAVNMDYVSSIELFDSDDATCEKTAVSMFQGGGVDGVRVIMHPGLTSHRAIIGVPEPTSLQINKQDGSHESMLTFGNVYGPVGVLTIDAADLKEGGVVKGKLSAATGPLPDDHKDEVSNVSGTFEAKVCKRNY